MLTICYGVGIGVREEEGDCVGDYAAEEVGAVAVAVLEDLKDEGLGEVEVEVVMGGVSSIPGVGFGVAASLWVFKMLKIRSKMRVLVYFRARFENFDFGATRLFWIEAFDVPVDCWCLEFFKKLGGQVGEMVCIDEETATRSRLDKARILIVAPLDSKMVSEVKVKGGYREFSVRLKEDLMHVSIDWVNQFLGLHPPSLMEASTRSMDEENSNQRVGEERAESEMCRVQAGKLSEKLDVPTNIRKKASFEMQNIPSDRNIAVLKKVCSDKLPTTALAIGHPKRVGGVRGGVDKGKGRIIYKMNSKSLWQPMCKGGVRIGVNKKGRSLQSSEEESSSFGPVLRHSQGPNFFVGEQSKVFEIQTLSPNSSTESEDNSLRPKYRRRGSYALESGTPFINNSAQPKEQTNNVVNSEQCESFVEETQVALQGKTTGQGISLCIDLRSNVSEKSGSDDSGKETEEIAASDLASMKGVASRKRGCREKRKKGKGVQTRVKSHPMKTRRPTGSKKRIKEVIWNLDEEITKVFEKGAELGVVFKSAKANNGTEEGDGQSKGRNWNLEDEVKKVVDTGIALGIDFNGREAEVMLYLSSREQEDEELFNE
ncbi:hypothetical protein Q3G72_001396 [Acer saccharum]|nr:hypothetical protein Q3G72_001396 [Acer saccharum]